MSYQKCVEEIAKAAGRPLTDAELETIGEKVAKIVQKLDVEGRAEAFDEALLKAIDEEADFAKAAAIVEKRNAVKNKIAFITQRSKLMNTWRDDLAEGLQALTGGSITGRTGSKNATATRQAALADRYTGGLGADLERAGLLKIASKGTLDDQVWKAMWHLNLPEPDMTVLNKLQPEAVKIAEIFNAWNEKARIDANKAGAWIKQLSGYVIKRTHDNLRIAQAGVDTWLNDVMSAIDWEKTLPDVPVADRGKVLREMYTDFASGVHVKFSEGGVTGFKGFANVGKRMSHERVLHFKTPEDEFAYNQKYGSGSLIEGMFYGLEHMARDTALMRDWGPNAKATYDSVVKDIQQMLKKAGDVKQQADVDKTVTYLDRVLWPHLTGEINIAENATFARYSGMVRNIETMADMGAAVLSAPSDIAFYGTALRQQGGGMLSGMAEAIGNLVRGVSGAERTNVIAEAGVILDSIRAPAMNRWSPDSGAPGLTAKGVQAVFKYNLLRSWTDRIRGGFVLATAHRLANHADRAFEALPEGMQNLLKQYDINAKEWDVIRQGAQRHADGKAFLTPEGLAELPDSVFGDTKYKAERARTELQDRMRAFFKDQAQTAVIEPNTMDRAMLLQGQRPGTAIGESLRHFWMYKGFTMSVMRRILGRELFGYGDTRGSISGAIFNMLKDPTGSAFVGMANVIVYSTIFGYGSMALKDLSKGREPRVPDNAGEFGKVFAAALAQGGGLGIYGDFLFGEMKSRYGGGPLETFLGPTWRRLETFADWYSRFKDPNKRDDLPAKAFNDVLRNVPFVNLFYTKWALDYLILYRLQEWSNPGYLRRMEHQLKDEKDQQFILPPSNVIPFGG